MAPDLDSPPVFSEREFYLREFRGRTLAFAVATPGAGLAPLGEVLEALAKGGARGVVILGEGVDPGPLGPLELLEAGSARLEGQVWRGLRAGRRMAVQVPGTTAFADGCRDVALRLGVPKLVWLDAAGGLGATSGQRVSFCDLSELRRRLAEGPAALARADLWRQVEAMIDAGIAAVNVCTLEGLDAELFTYAGSGTLFTRERYVSVRALGIDDFEAAHHLIERGVEEGYLAPRSPDEVDTILASGFGAFVENRDLAGLCALLIRPESRSGEISALYTLNRFLGEGIGGPLVTYALERARQRDLAFVFACTTSKKVGAFFEREGFREAPQSEIPDEKWTAYDAQRQKAVHCYIHDL